MIELSNSLADLAERVKVANEASALAERTTIEKAIEAGELAEYMRTIEALYAREADAMPRHEDFIARFCAAQNPAAAA